MLKKISLLILMGLVILAGSACSGGGDDPTSVADRFWKAVRTGGIEAGGRYTTLESQAAIDRGLQLGLSGNYILDEVTVTGDHATVLTKDGDGTAEKFLTVLVREKGVWKVDLYETVREIFGDEIVRHMESARR